MPKLPVIAKSVAGESRIESAVVKHAESLGFIAYKFTSPSRRGVPDRLVLYNGGGFFVEFKSPTGKLSADQEHEIAKLKMLGHEVFVISSVEEGIDILNRYTPVEDRGQDSRTLHQLDVIVTCHIDLLSDSDAEVIERLYEKDYFNASERAYVERLVDEYALEISSPFYWE